MMYLLWSKLYQVNIGMFCHQRINRVGESSILLIYQCPCNVVNNKRQVPRSIDQLHKPNSLIVKFTSSYTSVIFIYMVFKLPLITKHQVQCSIPWQDIAAKCSWSPCCLPGMTVLWSKCKLLVCFLALSLLNPDCLRLVLLSQLLMVLNWNSRKFSINFFDQSWNFLKIEFKMSNLSGV